MKRWIVVGLALLSLAACAPYPYYYRDDGYYRDGYYGRPYYRGNDYDRYYHGDGRYYDER
ncbi:MAG TPA: hypothetical protein VKB67_14760 [Rhizomicrobium sp.]|nr:hypothetical protein [Rhizomicrobium sp.]